MTECTYQFSFERLDAWKLSRKLVSETYILLRQFPSDEKYGLISQAKRASVSIPTNLAEGGSRNSMKERKHFYEISFGSLIELLNLLTIGFDLGYINSKEYKKFRDKIHVLAIVINALSKSTQKPP
jgi:four helix bundle protein